MTYPLTAYIEAAMEIARYDKIEDGTFSAEIPKLRGVIAFGKTLPQCERELRSTLEDWILVGLRLGHTLPKLSGIWLQFYASDEERAKHQKEWPNDTIPAKQKLPYIRDWRLPKGPF
jgi:predicted RNase H-like HicB family nuclease